MSYFFIYFAVCFKIQSILFIFTLANIEVLIFKTHIMLQDNFVINRTLIQKLGLSCAAYYTEIINTIFSTEGASTSVALTMSHFSSTLGISRVKQENHRKKLEQLGVLKVERKGLPAKLHFSIDNQCEVNIKKILV